MDPQYRRFFNHVWAFCWPWLWWNLVRLTAWQQRTGRDVFIVVDKMGNVYVQHVGDAPAPDDLYTYEAPLVPRWERPALGSDLPAELCAEAPAGRAGGFRTCPGIIRGVFGVFPGSAAHVRGPP